MWGFEIPKNLLEQRPRVHMEPEGTYGAYGKVGLGGNVMYLRGQDWLLQRVIQPPLRIWTFAENGNDRSTGGPTMAEKEGIMRCLRFQ